MTTITSALRDADNDVAPNRPILLSIVMPCLNEAETIARCIEKAQSSIRALGVAGEIVVADNGSTDGSREIAANMGARVIPVPHRGYGNALLGGITAARGKYIIMGDADDSYDFSNLGAFLQKLREGYDLVMGNRFKGGIKPGAMPALHRYLGNPGLTAMARMLFWRPPCGDFYCGLRGFTRDAALKMDLRTTGMEFATEMVVKAVLHKMKIVEVPTTLSPDGRTRPPHLRTWRDGWRGLRFLLLYSPRWLFFYPGLILMLTGLVGALWLLPGPRSIGAVTIDVHSLLYCALAILLGFQACLFAVFTKVFAIGERLLPEDPRLTWIFRYVTLEVGLLTGATLLIGGIGGTVYALRAWEAVGLGPLDPSRMLRVVIPSVTATALGFQTILSSFFLSILGLRRR